MPTNRIDGGIGPGGRPVRASTARSGGVSAAGPGNSFIYPAGTRMPNGAISDGKGGTMGSGGTAGASSGGSGGAAPSLSLRADTNQALEALSGRYNKHLDNLSSASGEIMDTAASRIRDAREGGRRSIQESGALGGRASDPALAQYDAETTGLQAGAIADTAALRESNLTSALQGGVGVMGAPANLALSEKGLQVNAFQAQNAANNQAFQQFLSLLNANRTSPIYMG